MTKQIFFCYDLMQSYDQQKNEKKSDEIIILLHQNKKGV